MKTRIFNTIILLLICGFTFAQTTSDALRFSQSFNGGTARFVGMGGAFGALGGDFGSLNFNPAGLGVYRTSEFTITPSFKNRTVSSDYNGTNGSDNKNSLNFDNIGFVFSFKPNGDSQDGLVNFNIAFGYNRTNDFNTNALAKGNNDINSIMDYFAINADSRYICDSLTSPSNNPYKPFNKYGVGAWESIMAWNTFLIDTMGGKNHYVASLNSGDGVKQSNSSSIEGGSGEYVFSLGTNFSNKFYIGATFGITNIDYSTTTTYGEDAYQSNGLLPNGNRFYYSDYKQTIETKGTGYNLKLGMIYKPIEGLRLGLAFHTPTYLKFQETFSYYMYSNFDFSSQETSFDINSPNSRYDYKLETPFKTIGSIAYVFKDFGLISLDYEHVNYSSMRFRDGGDGYDYANENEGIKDAYQNVNNIRVGGEVKVSNIFLRGGYAFYPSPYKDGYLNKNANRSIISSGIGYRSHNFFIDASYMYSIQKEKYVFYDLNNVNPVSTKTTEGKLLVTVGFKF